MLEQFHYDSDLIGGSLMVRESRLIADLLLRPWKRKPLPHKI